MWTSSKGFFLIPNRQYLINHQSFWMIYRVLLERIPSPLRKMTQVWFLPLRIDIRDCEPYIILCGNAREHMHANSRIDSGMRGDSLVCQKNFYWQALRDLCNYCSRRGYHCARKGNTTNGISIPACNSFSVVVANDPSRLQHDHAYVLNVRGIMADRNTSVPFSLTLGTVLI